MRRWLIRIGIVAVPALMVVGFIVFQRSMRYAESRAELAAAVAEIEAADPQWRWHEIEAARDLHLPDDRNGLVVGMEFSAASKTMTRHPESEMGFEGVAGTSENPNHALHADDAKVLRWYLDLCAPQAAVLEKFRACEHGHRPLPITKDSVSMLLPHVQPTREVASLLRYQARMAVHDGDLKAAAGLIGEELRLAEMLASEPTLISQLVHVAILAIAVGDVNRLLAQGELGAADLAKLQKALADAFSGTIMIQGFRGERAGFHHLMNNIQNGTVDLETTIQSLLAMNAAWGGPPPTNWDKVKVRWQSFQFGPHLGANHAFILRYLSQIIAAMKLPPAERIAALQALPTVPDEPRWIIARSFLPSLEKVAEADTRCRASLATAVAGIACERFRLKHNRWPTNLDELVPAFLPSVPDDAYDGKPLKLRKFDDGIAVYSVGMDRVENGGEIWTGGDQKGKDFGFRLWDVAARRVPPPPKEPEVLEVMPFDPDDPESHLIP